MNSYDVIVIGGGPAGCAAALDLNQRGYNVALCDQAKFPRDKVCGEFISPGADPILKQLGVLNTIESLAPKRLKGVAISSYESVELGIDYPAATETAVRPTSLSVPRYQLDALFLKQVQSAGVKVFEQHFCPRKRHTSESERLSPLSDLRLWPRAASSRTSLSRESERDPTV